MQSAMGNGLPGSTGPFMGVGSSATGPSIIAVNGESTYESWEFLYDPRIEKLKAAAALNAGVGSTGAGALGGQVSSFGPAGAASPAGAVGPAGPVGGAGAAGGATPAGGTTPTGP